MDTRQVAHEVRRQQWSVVMRERRESGLTIRDFCRERGINEKTFYYWQRKLRESVCENLAVRQETAMAPVPSFAEVRMLAESPGKDAIRVRLGDAEVEIGGDVSPVAIEAVLRTLGSR